MSGSCFDCTVTFASIRSYLLAAFPWVLFLLAPSVPQNSPDCMAGTVAVPSAGLASAVTVWDTAGDAAAAGDPVQRVERADFAVVAQQRDDAGAAVV